MHWLVHTLRQHPRLAMLLGAGKVYCKDFADFPLKNFEPVDVVFRFAEQTGVVLMSGAGFDGPQWSISVSLANLNEEDYVNIGRSIRKIFDDYHNAWNAESS